jgi:hypothetical protein
MIPGSTTSAIDMFGNGEQLGPTMGYIHGKKLFTDIFFLHGAGEDVLVPALSFTLFNHGNPSIGSYVLLTDILQTVSSFLFFILLAKLIKPKGLYLFVTLWFIGTSYSGFEYMKNIPVYIVLALYWLWFNQTLRLRTRLLILGAIGFLSSGALLDSIDVGVIMSALAIAFAAGLLFIKRREDRSLTLRVPSLDSLKKSLEPLAIISGLVVAQIGILLFLGFNSYETFIRMTFSQIPKYQGLMFDYPVNQLNPSFFLFWLPILLAGLTLYMLAGLVIKQVKKDRHIHPEVAYAFLMMIFSGLYLRFGVGRPDFGHIDMAAPLLLLSSFYIIYLYLREGLVDKEVRHNFWVVGLFAILLFWPQITWNPLSLFAGGNVTPLQVKEMKDLPAKPDNTWLTPQEEDVTTYLTSNMKPTDGLFVLVPDPLYYYLTDRPNPSRFYITWFADPQQFTNELLSSLKKNPPKYIVYSDGSSPYEITDGIPITQRIPEVNTWVLKNYPVKTIIGQVVLLSK